MKPISSMRFVLIIFILLGSTLEINTKAKCQCEKDSDCLGNHICRERVCKHRGFFPPNFSQFIEIVFMCALSAVATAAGVGGGAIYSALLMFIENFDAKVAFPISSFSIFLCSVLTFYLGVKNKIQNPKMRFIDYDLVIVFCPALLLGTKIGVILNTIFPTLLLIIFLILSLSFSSFKTYKNALKAYRREQEMKVKKNEKGLALIDFNNQYEELEVIKNDYPMIQRNGYNEPFDVFYGVNAPIRLDRVKWVILLQVCMLLDQLLEGSNKMDSIIDLEKCGKYFWGIFLLFIFFCLGFTKIFYKQIKDELQNQSLNIYTDENEFNISSPDVEAKITKIIVFCFLAGTISGMLGIGGGIFMAPLMLELGINTKVATSTSNLFLMFTSFSSSCLYLMAGNTVVSYCLMFGFICGLFSYWGNKFLSDYIERTNKSSLLIWTIFGVSVISLVILPINGIRHALYDMKIGKSILKLNSYC